MNNEKLIFCPICHKTTSALPVAEIYFALIENKLIVPNDHDLTKSLKRDLFRYLAPPNISRQPIWFVLNPDIFFGALMLIFLFSALFGYIDGKITLLNATTPIVLLTIIYFLLRKRILSFYLLNQQKREEISGRIAAKANEWSNSYYCFHDSCIYHPGDEHIFSLIEFHQRMLTSEDLQIDPT